MRIPVATNRRDGGAQASLYELAPRPGIGTKPTLPDVHLKSAFG